MEKNKKTIVIRIIVVTIALLVGIFMAINDRQNDAYCFNFVLPITFGIIYFCFSGITRYCNHIGMFFLNIIMIIRYVITPLISSIGSYNVWRGTTPNEADVSFAILLMFYELIMISVTINVFGNNLYKLDDNKIIDGNRMKNREISIIIPIIVVSVIAIILANPNVLKEYIFITNFSNTMVDETDIPLIGLWKTLIEFVRLLLVISIITKCKKAYDKKANPRYVVMSMSAVILNMCFSSGLSRWSVVVPGFIFIFMLSELYPAYRRKIIFYAGCSFFLLIAALSAKKFISPEATILGFNEINIDWWADSLQMYFSGPKNIAIGISTKELIDKLLGYSSFEIFFNDMFSNVAVLNKFTTDSLKSVFYFNSMYYGQVGVNDQIIPMISQSFIYFGFLFSPLLSCVSIIMMMWCDGKANKSNDLMLLYIYTFAAINFSRAIMLNWTIISANFLNNFFIFIFIYRLNNIIKLKRIT